MNRFESVTGGAACHSTPLPKGGDPFAGFNPLMWLMTLLLTMFVAGCGGGSSVLGVSGASTPGPVPGLGTATSMGLKVTPSGVAPSSLISIPVTGTQQYTAIETFSDGSTIDRTAVSSWTSSAAVAALSVNGATGGLATGAAAGTATITATYTVGAVVQTASAPLTVNAAISKSFVVKPATTVSIPVSGTQQYTAIETFSDGATFDRTAAASWTSVNVPLGGAAVATLSANGATGGLATGAAIGTATITATLGLQSSTATMTVNAATSKSFVVKPATAVSIPVSGTQQYAAIETFSDGTTFDRTAASSWTSVNVPLGGAAVATLSANGAAGGLATGAAIGTATITATLGLQSSSATLTVNAATTKTFKVTPLTTSTPVGGSQQFVAIETFSDGTTFDRTAASSWTSVNVPLGGAAVATLSANGATGGLATGAAIGTATITATLGLQTATATFNVSAATSKSFSVKPATATIAVAGGTQQFTALETFSDGSIIDRTAASNWTAVDIAPAAGVATIGLNTGTATGKALGQSTITASFGIYTGIVGLANRTAILTVTAPNPGIAGAAPTLGTAKTYGIIATNAITSSNIATHIYGDVALTLPSSTSTSVTGPGFFDGAAALPLKTSTGVTTGAGVTPGMVNTTDNGNSASLPQLQIDLNAAYADLSTRVPTTRYAAGAKNLSGLTFIPGIYAVGLGAPAAGDTFALSTPVVLDAQGNPDAVFVFQAHDITTTTGSVLLQGGAQAKNVFWVLTATATVGNGASTLFQGTIVAGNTITVAINTIVEGRMLAGALGAGAITVSGVINVPK